jgi:heme oxygenase
MSMHMVQAAAMTAPPPLSLRLRLGTRAAHARIEENGRFGRLMAPDLTRAEYVGLLARLFGHHAAAEAALAAAVGLLPQALQLGRRLARTALLAGDLRALGLPQREVAALPRCAMPPMDGAEQAWGLLYVLEGSALGGQMIARHLLALFGLDAGSGAAGLVPHGPDSGALWRDFKALLDAAGEAGTVEPEAVVEAANAAFARLDAWVAG